MYVTEEQQQPPHNKDENILMRHLHAMQRQLSDLAINKAMKVGYAFFF